jgi:hypothetical protein
LQRLVAGLPACRDPGLKSFDIQTFVGSLEKVARLRLRIENGGSDPLLPNGILVARWRQRYPPRCSWYQRHSAFGSLARKKNPPISVTSSISVPLAIPSRPAAPDGGRETFGCTAVGAAMASWFRPKMKLDPKANDRVRSSWRLRKASHPPSEKSAARATILAQFWVA